MKLENQVTTLETSKKLKELKVKQESLYYWVHPYNKSKLPKVEVAKNKWVLVDKLSDLFYRSKSDVFSAFTVAELLELLPASVHKLAKKPLGAWLSLEKTDDNKYVAGYGDEGVNVLDVRDNLAVEAVAKMLIYLLKSKLIIL